MNEVIYISMKYSEHQNIVYVDPTVDEEEPEITGDRRKHMAHLWKKGQSGNILGRPKGKTMKDYVKEMLSKLDDEERLEFLKGIPKDVIWRMAEGNPTEDKTVKISVPTPILGGISQGTALESKDSTLLKESIEEKA